MNLPGRYTPTAHLPLPPLESASYKQHTTDQVNLIRLHGQQWKELFTHEAQQRRAIADQGRQQYETLASQGASPLIRTAAILDQMGVLAGLTRQFNAERQALKERQHQETLALKPRGPAQ